MNPLVKIPGMIVRFCALVIIVLGILIWTGVGDNQTVIDIHILFGILIVLSLWVMAIAQARIDGSVGLAIGVVVFGAFTYIFGLNQADLLPSAHWIIQITHLLVGLVAIGFAEMISARAKKVSAIAK